MTTSSKDTNLDTKIDLDLGAVNPGYVVLSEVLKRGAEENIFNPRTLQEITNINSMPRGNVEILVNQRFTINKGGRGTTNTESDKPELVSAIGTVPVLTAEVQGRIIDALGYEDGEEIFDLPVNEIIMAYTHPDHRNSKYKHNQRLLFSILGGKGDDEGFIPIASSSNPAFALNTLKVNMMMLQHDKYPWISMIGSLAPFPSGTGRREVPPVDEINWMRNGVRDAYSTRLMEAQLELSPKNLPPMESPCLLVPLCPDTVLGIRRILGDIDELKERSALSKQDAFVLGTYVEAKQREIVQLYSHSDPSNEIINMNNHFGDLVKRSPLLKRFRENPSEGLVLRNSTVYDEDMTDETFLLHILRDLSLK